MMCASSSALRRPQPFRSNQQQFSCCRIRPRRSIFVAASSQPDPHRAAAERLVELCVRNNSRVALGTGPLVNLVIERIGALLASGELQNVVGVPTFDLAAHEAAFHGVPLRSLEELGKVDVLVEQPDQLDLQQNAFLKGVRSTPTQPQLLRLYDAAASADWTVLIVDPADVVPRLGGSLPVVIDNESWETTAEELDDLFLGDAELWRRAASGPAPPRGGDNPYVSPEGHAIIDVRFYEGVKLFGQDEAYQAVAGEIEKIPGVVCDGLMLEMADVAFIAAADGTVVHEYTNDVAERLLKQG